MFFFFPQLSRILGQHLNRTDSHSTWSTLLREMYNSSEILSGADETFSSKMIFWREKLDKHPEIIQSLAGSDFPIANLDLCDGPSDGIDSGGYRDVTGPDFPLER